MNWEWEGYNKSKTDAPSRATKKRGGGSEPHPVREGPNSISLGG